MSLSAAPATIPQALARAGERFPHHEALVDGDVRLTFPEFAAAVDGAARALIASGIEPGDRVAIWAQNMGEWAIAAFGIHAVGGVLVPLNTRFKGSEAQHILAASGARLLFTVTDFLGADYVAMLGEPPEALTEIVVLRGPTDDGAPGRRAGRLVGWADFLARGAAVDPAVSVARAAAVGPDDLCDLLFTSGTTGAPKGAMLRHEATVRAYTAWTDVIGLGAADRYLIVNPFFHAFGLKAGLLACVLTGATIIPHPVFDVPSVMRRVAEEGVTMLPGPPAIYQTILDHPDLSAYDLSTLRLAVTGAAAVPVEMIRRMRSELTFQTIVTGYGLTESTGIATMCRHDDDPETIATTAGRAIPDVEVIVAAVTAGVAGVAGVAAAGAGAGGADDSRPDLALQTVVEARRGEPGEVLVRGYNVMAGFWGNDAATVEAIDAEGWLHTGDIGIMDPAGNLRITDRMKDMFICGGFNAYPAEIEGMIMRHPAVSQVAVVGMPDHRLGEVARAFVIPRPGERIEPAELIAWCREQMANYKVPRTVEIVDAFPLNASGKVLKYQLRDRPY